MCFCKKIYQIFFYKTFNKILQKILLSIKNIFRFDQNKINTVKCVTVKQKQTVLEFVSIYSYLINLYFLII